MAQPQGSVAWQRLMDATWRFSRRPRRFRLAGRGGACLAAACALTAGATLAGLVAMPAGAALLASPLASSKPEAAQPATSWREIQRAAKAAHDAGDFQAYRAGVQRLFELLSGHPDTVFAMAKAEARLGHAAAALGWLDDFAAMGLVRDAAAEPDLASLRQLAGFAAVVARIEANRRPVARSVRAFTLPDRAMLSEDIAYDPGARRFFVSSIHDAKIVAIDAGNGTATDFVPAGRDAIWGVLALAVDARRGVLWATTAAMPQTRGYRAADAGHTAVLRYDLATGKLQKRYDLAVPNVKPVAAAGGAAKDARPPAPGAASPPDAPAGAAGEPEPAEERDRVLGDMTVGAGGDVFVSEAVTGAVYVIRRGRDALEMLVAPGTFISPQTP